MTISKIDELMMLGHELIDFEALTSQVLAELVLANEDMFVATCALSELGIRKDPLAGEVASAVFKQDLGDKFIKTSAFGILYKWKKAEALSVFDAIVEDTPLIVLDEIIMCIDSEEVESYKKDPYLNALVYRLIKRIQTVGQANLEDPDVADFLFRHFPDLKERAVQEMKACT